MPPLTPKQQQVTVRDRVLRTCAHGDCLKHRIWSFETCEKHLTDQERRQLREQVSEALRTGAPLRGSVLSGANLRGLDFTGADLSGAFLDYSDLRETRMVDANLRSAYLGWARLDDADLSRAEIHGAVFTNASMRNVKLLGYSLANGRHPINLEARNFGRASVRRRPSIDETNPYTAAAAYQGLKRYFIAEGDYDSSSWASYCERAAQRKQLWRSRELVAWGASALFAALCGYGERPLRTIGVAFGVIAIYAAAYSGLGLLVSGSQPVALLDCLFFSSGALAGYGLPDITTIPTHVARGLVASESVIGVFVLGVFIFALTKRFVAR